MNTRCLLGAACFAAVTVSAWADSPFDAFKGKMKEGLYEYKVEMDMSQMPGVPANMAKQSTSLQHCLTADEIEKGSMGRSGRDGKMPEDCDVKDFKMSGNSASYKVVCKGANPMTSENNIMFRPDGYKMDMNMVMNQGGQTVKMAQHVDSHYLGACTK